MSSQYIAKVKNIFLKNYYYNNKRNLPRMGQLQPKLVVCETSQNCP